MNARLENKFFWRRKKPQLAYVQISTWEGEGGCLNGICYGSPVKQKLVHFADVLRVKKAVFVRTASEYLAGPNRTTSPNA